MKYATTTVFMMFLLAAAFIGGFAGQSNTIGGNNTAIGMQADVGATNLNFATAIGAGAIVPSSNTVVLGRGVDTVRIPGAMSVAGSTTFGGTLAANIFNATTQYNIGVNRVLSVAGTSNLFVGVGAGEINTGTENTFVGAGAGQANTAGFANAFFGNGAGSANIGGDRNAFFGQGTGFNNNDGQENAFLGNEAGLDNTTGGSNTFVGRLSGSGNTTGSGNVFIGYDAGPSSNNLTSAVAIGPNARVSQSHSMVLGGSLTKVGIGTTAPEQKLHVVGNEILSTGTQSGFKFRDRGSISADDDWVWYSNGNTARFFRAGTGDLLSIQTNGNTGIGTVPTFKLHVVDPSNTGLRVQTNTGGGTVASFGGTGAFQVDSPGVAGGRLKITESGQFYFHVPEKLWFFGRLTEHVGPFRSLMAACSDRSQFHVRKLNRGNNEKAFR